MLVTFLLADGRPPFRVLWDGELPNHSPLPQKGEPVSFNGRGYRVEERSFRFGSRIVSNDAANAELGTLVPFTPVEMAVGILVNQISGPPHVVS